MSIVSPVIPGGNTNHVIYVFDGAYASEIVQLAGMELEVFSATHKPDPRPDPNQIRETKIKKEINSITEGVFQENNYINSGLGSDYDYVWFTNPSCDRENYLWHDASETLLPNALNCSNFTIFGLPLRSINIRKLSS